MSIALLLRYWRYIAGAAILGVIWWQLHAYGVRKYDAGKAHVQAKWDQANVVAKAAADAKTRENELQDAADAARNIEVEKEHAKELAAASADRDRNYRLLQQARQRSTPSSCPAPEGSGFGGTTDASETGGAESTEDAAYRRRLDAIDAAVADLMEEARANASQLDSLIGQIVPQL